MPASVAADPTEVEAVVDVDAGPASPPTQPPLASAAGENGRPAPALVPTVTTLEPEVLPVPAPEVIAVPVPEPPSVEGADLPALEVPPVPDVPVEVGDALPVLPGS